MDRHVPPAPNEGTPRDATSREATTPDETIDRERERGVPRADHVPDTDEPNPPHTTTGKITSPKFGSAGSGGAEYEPGPKKN
jgi:hypothetical protein